MLGLICAFGPVETLDRVVGVLNAGLRRLIVVLIQVGDAGVQTVTAPEKAICRGADISSQTFRDRWV